MQIRTDRETECIVDINFAIYENVEKLFELCRKVINRICQAKCVVEDKKQQNYWRGMFMDRSTLTQEIC